jgi:hypothetical protein
MTTVIDKRGTPLTVTFGDLDIGDYYQDEEGFACIKTSEDTCIFYREDEQCWDKCKEFEDTLIIPLKATVTIERAN